LREVAIDDDPRAAASGRRWEWEVKRLAASPAIARCESGLGAKDRTAVRATVLTAPRTFERNIDETREKETIRAFQKLMWTASPESSATHS
jgi:hypothetical protein